MVATNQTPPPGDSDKAKKTGEWYTALAAEFMCRSLVGMQCPCPVCGVTASADSVLGVACGATVNALNGKPEMLAELLTFVAELTAKYPS